MCFCVDYNPMCMAKYCKSVVDSALKVKESIDSNLFDSLMANKINQFDSLMRDTISVKYWYNFFDNSLEKVLSIHVGIFSALVTFAVAMILIKYWFDHSKFEERIKEIEKERKEEIDVLKNELAVVKETANEVERAKKDMEELLNKYEGNLAVYNASITNDVKNVECKMKLFFEFKKIQNGFSLNEFDSFLSLVNNYLKNAEKSESRNRRNDLVLWMITEKIWMFIGKWLNSNYLKPYKRLYHNMAFELKKYTDDYSKSYPGSSSLEFTELNVFCESFGIEKNVPLYS